jgi:NIMA (never in mitosis gene a)-related kinase/serine/threonine-protein kinase
MAARPYLGQNGRTYEPIEHIGPGGFGAVERVRDDDGREYALKTLHLGIEPQVLADEAQNLARVHHDNVVGYVDYGVDPEPFLVMDLAGGGTLKDYLAAAQQKGEHFPIETLVDWAKQLLRGLEAIHEVLLHRDLKPGNVLFEGDVLKIGDFGMTRLTEASTRTETLKGGGTPLYMPPEGWAGPGGPTPTPAYDLYSLGIILYELATLQTPFSGSREELGRAHLYQEVRSPRELREDLPPTLERLVLMLLRKAPGERGSSAEECLELLDRVPVEEAGQLESSDVIRRLQEGASSLMRAAAEREAEMERARDALAHRRELLEQAMVKLDELVNEARDIVASNIAPVELTIVTAKGGVWAFRVEYSTRMLRLELGSRPDEEMLQGGNPPGDIVAFGHIEVSDDDPATQRPMLGGANIVGFVLEDAPWVIHYQEIQLRNMALMSTPMRRYEPFFLNQRDLAEHGRWLWGGAMHVYTPTHRELTVEVLVEWFSQLVPS